MTLTIKQRLLITFVKSGIDLLWFLDNLSIKHVVITGITTFLLIVVGTRVSNNYNFRTISSLNNGIIYSIYGSGSTDSSSSNSNVLGISTVKKEIPVFLDKTEFPSVSAKSYLVVDKLNLRTLAQQNMQQRAAPASTTKLLTVLVALDIYNLDDYISVPADCLSIDTTKLWLPTTQQFRVGDLINAALISSAGDAACALAAGKTNYTDFVQMMNDKALSIGMSNSYFSNPIGLDGFANTHYSTAQDLLILAKVAMSKEPIKNAVSTKNFTLKSKDNSFSLKVANTNKLLWELPGTVGIKTGTTLEAGEVLIYEYKKDTKDLMIVVMGSNDRFYDTKKILNWSLENYSWE